MTMTMDKCIWDTLVHFGIQLVKCQCEHYWPQKDTDKVTLHTLDSQYDYSTLDVSTIIPLLLYVSLYKYITKFTLTTNYFTNAYHVNELHVWLETCHFPLTKPLIIPLFQIFHNIPNIDQYIKINTFHHNTSPLHFLILNTSQISHQSTLIQLITHIGQNSIIFTFRQEQV